jgi:hypothetical protein
MHVKQSLVPGKCPRPVRELGSDFRTDTMQAWREAEEQQLRAERELAAARGEEFATEIDIGPHWDVGAPLPHLISNGGAGVRRVPG